VQLALAAGAGSAVDIDDDLDRRQMRRQRAADYFSKNFLYISCPRLPY
jgi:hypothetical protein